MNTHTSLKALSSIPLELPTDEYPTVPYVGSMFYAIS